LGKGAKNYADQEDVVDEVYEGLIRETKLAVKYQSKSGRKVEGVIIPLTMVMFNSGLFLVARFDGEDEPREYTFALDNFLEVRSLRKEPFQYPLDYHPEKMFDGSFGLIRGDGQSQKEVVLEFKNSSWVGEYLRQRRWTGRETYESLDGGDGGLTRFSMRVGDLKEVRSWLMGIAGEVRIIKPESLRQEVMAECRKILDNNG
jgi:predicted DNA-binding transcriptional regulator YafY